MTSQVSSKKCPSIPNNTSPYSTKYSYDNRSNKSSVQNVNNSRPASCYRPLQQLYKTIYSPTSGKNSSQTNFACICQPSERYKTTNMTYGSFHYNNWAFMQKNRRINTKKKLFTQCIDQNNQQQKINMKSKDNNRLTSTYTSDESQHWDQTTSRVCCPTNCCNDTTLNVVNY